MEKQQLREFTDFKLVSQEAIKGTNDSTQPGSAAPLQGLTAAPEDEEGQPVASGGFSHRCPVYSGDSAASVQVRVTIVYFIAQILSIPTIASNIKLTFSFLDTTSFVFL